MLLEGPSVRSRTPAHAPGVGPLLRGWRAERGISQLELALDAGISTRHLSYVENGRSRPSPQVVGRLADRLRLADDDRRELLLAAGHAPDHRPLLGDEIGRADRAALQQVVAACGSLPAVVVDAHWGLVAANDAVAALVAGVADHLLAPPVNVLRVALHPEGLAPAIENHAEWRGQVLDRLARQAAATGDRALEMLHGELASLPGGRAGRRLSRPSLVSSLQLRIGGRRLRFTQTVTAFAGAGTPRLDGVAVVMLLPADGCTAHGLQHLSRGSARRRAGRRPPAS